MTLFCKFGLFKTPLWEFWNLKILQTHRDKFFRPRNLEATRRPSRFNSLRFLGIYFEIYTNYYSNPKFLSSFLNKLKIYFRHGRKNYLVLHIFQIWKFWIKSDDGHYCQKFIFWGQNYNFVNVSCKNYDFHIIVDSRCQAQVRLSMLRKLWVLKIDFGIFFRFRETLRSNRKVWEFLLFQETMWV